MKVITRFAPSPTGFLHIGSARTALFNYLFAKRHNGKFLLRIEDTDKQRSSAHATQSLLSGLRWLGINWDAFDNDENEVYQSKRFKRHQEIAIHLLNQGKAYKCFMTSEEIASKRDKAISAGEPFLLISPWRDTNEQDHPQDQAYVIRFKTPHQGSTIINDLIHGEIKFENNTIEDMVLLRSDFEPLYNLCVFVDDHDMGITHIIRGDDHITNAARQTLLYQAMNWNVPSMAHIPLIHGDDGSKLSKRHGATNVEDYKALGYLPESLVNYILRLGWSYDGPEIISLDQAIEKFDVADIGKSCSRIDFNKMKNINAKYIRSAAKEALSDLVIDQLTQSNIAVNDQERKMIEQGMPGMQVRAEFVNDLTELSKIYLLNTPLHYPAEISNMLSSKDQIVVTHVIDMLNNLTQTTEEDFKSAFKELALKLDMKLGDLMMPIRILLTASTSCPSVFEIIAIIGKDTAVQRLEGFYKLCL